MQTRALANDVGILTKGYAPAIVEPVRVTLVPSVVCVAVAVWGNRKLLVAPPPAFPVSESVPVQLAPVGQQATLSAASRVHLLPSAQHISE